MGDGGVKFRLLHALPMSGGGEGGNRLRANVKTSVALEFQLCYEAVEGRMCHMCILHESPEIKISDWHFVERGRDQEHELETN